MSEQLEAQQLEIRSLRKENKYLSSSDKELEACNKVIEKFHFNLYNKDEDYSKSFLRNENYELSEILL